MKFPTLFSIFLQGRPRETSAEYETYHKELNSFMSFAYFLNPILLGLFTFQQKSFPHLKNIQAVNQAAYKQKTYRQI